MNGEFQKNIIQVVFGPTAGGKSAKAMEMAEMLGGAVINADATQLYADLRILSARPSAEEERRVPHYLYGVLEGGRKADVAWWVTQAVRQIRQMWQEETTPILCGGTGMYIAALMQGIAEVPQVPEAVRAEVAAYSNAELQAKLREVDPLLGTTLKEGDTQRLRRAYEVWLATGKPLSWWQKEVPKKLPIPEAEWKMEILNPPRVELYARIDRRFLQMMEAGAEEEVRGFLEKNYPPLHPLMKAVGVPELAAYLNGEIGREEAIALAQQHSRNYAKRQITWLKNQFGLF